MDKSEKGGAYYGCERREILQFIPEGCTQLLDIGCGSGRFGALVKQTLDCEVWGVEPVHDAAQMAGRWLDKVFEEPFTGELDLPRNRFDVVTFNDSLEHFPYPEPPLKLCHELLTDGGTIICSVPNVRYIDNVKNLLIEKDWRYEEDGILDHTHLRFFTKKSIERTLSSLGYHVESSTGINPRGWWDWKLRALELAFPNYVSDMKYMQFVVVASKTMTSKSAISLLSESPTL